MVGVSAVARLTVGRSECWAWGVARLTVGVPRGAGRRGALSGLTVGRAGVWGCVGAMVEADGRAGGTVMVDLSKTSGGRAAGVTIPRGYPILNSPNSCPLLWCSVCVLSLSVCCKS